MKTLKLTHPCFLLIMGTAFIASLMSGTYVQAEEPAAQPPAHAELTPEQLKFFESKIRPLLVESCISCHGPDKQKGALRLDVRASAIEIGGESGSPAIIPGKPDESLLMEAVRYESYEMPPEKPLSEDKIALLETWIRQGAPWPENADSPKVKLAVPGISEEDRQYWAFQPMQRAEVPQVKRNDWPQNEIDHFVLARLEQEELTPAKPAAPRELIRRLYYDLTGLPPSQAEVEEFLADPSAKAYIQTVDRLLTSPRYGEHMARQWLDLVRYAESDGYRQDAYRPLAWRYRDYVIESFNSDKPYDQFVREQLAGDEIAPENPDALIATGFLRHGVYEYNQRDVKTQWQEILNEMTDVTSDVFLGLGMSCARCHNHKFDPILQEDYFGLQAFFSPVLWVDDVPIATPEEREAYEQQLAKWEAATETIRQQIDEIEQPILTRLENASIVMFPEDVQEMIRKPKAERTPYEEQVRALAWRQVEDRHSRLKSQLKGETLKKWEALQKELAQFADLKPKPLQRGMTVCDVCSQAPPTNVKTRRETKQIEPHYLEVMSTPAPKIFPPQELNSTGRRSTLAEWLTQPHHPLTARVMVNRIWQHHFGKGLVASVSDFGNLGEPPSHPELLDWLALQFVENGWSIKQMHRLILLTATYQQSSHPSDNPDSAAQAMLLDPQNRLFWRMNAHRLNADQIRDSILSATGELSDKLGGPSGTVEETRRSIYTKLIRNDQHPFFTAFDAPRGTSSTPERNNTTTSTQALLMMNSDWILKRAGKLAETVAYRAQSDEPTQLIEQLYWQTLRRAPSATELRSAEQYLQQSLYENQNREQDDQSSLLTWGEIPQRSGKALVLTDQTNAPRPVTSANLLNGQSDFSVEAVVMLKSFYPNSNVRTIVSQWNNSQQSRGWSLGLTSEKSRYRPGNLILQLIGENSSGAMTYEVIASNLFLKANHPYAVAVTVALHDTSEAGITFYVKDLVTNEERQSSQAAHQVVKNFVDSRTKVVVGGRDTNAAQFWDGSLDDIRISQARLTEEELLLHAEGQNSATVAEWRFEQVVGALRDLSTAGHHLSLNVSENNDPLQMALTDIAHVLLNSNEFLYVD